MSFSVFVSKCHQMGKEKDWQKVHNVLLSVSLQIGLVKEKTTAISVLIIF